MELTNLLENVKDEDSFILFVKALLNERYEDIELEKKSPSNQYGPTIKGWQNTTLEGFIEASIGWAEDSNFGNSQNIKENPWYKFAVFLYCGKVYE